MQVGKGSVYGTLLHHITPSRSPHNALHSPSYKSYPVTPTENSTLMDVVCAG